MALLDRLGLRDETGGIVAAALRSAGAAGRGARIVLANPDRDRGRARLEVVARRAGDHEEPVFLGRAHAEKRLGREHEGAQVKRAAIDGGKPLAIGGNELLHRFEEQLFGQFGHCQPPRRCVEACRVRLRAEQRHGPVLLAIGFHPLEDFLRIMQDRAGRIERQRAVGHHARVVPAFAFGPFDRDHMVRETGAKAGIAQDLRTAHRIGGGRVLFEGKRHRLVSGGSRHECPPVRRCALNDCCASRNSFGIKWFNARSSTRHLEREREKGRPGLSRGAALRMVSGGSAAL